MRIFNIILASTFLVGMALFSWSCVGEDVTARQQTTAAATLEPLPDTVYLRGQQPASLTFEIETPNGSGADRIEKVDFYKTIKLPTNKEDSFDISQETFLTSVTQVPSQLEMTVQDLITGTAYSTENEIPGGAIWDVRWEITLKDGKLLRPTDTTEIDFRCPSNLLDSPNEVATYLASHNGCQAEPVNVTIERDTLSAETNKYLISDIAAGYVIDCNGEPNFRLPFGFSETCGIISKESKSFVSRRFAIIEGSTWDDATKTLKIIWTNPLDGQTITSTFVKQ
ncbi:hypothetical protein Fleli_1434 [Bernardetia litoralis DSM 6794]|uniref:Uncharacterized protein n=1 Tax=Bernardetia litoralis (strain ATCC 23117 / DSM 6794 / NBRC 15988 / NCIMB 1366 / Fx l1 / Sio-4) TaxID=880071 RepID=I4AIS6_BERLS|nr:hypothetical protein [Bernardetia litoralis]AFM03861.1 hypothetical protein Fleli_1434 [Bernardetia litoralis DSM 6794]